MRNVEIHRLRDEGLTQREIAEKVEMPRETVRNVLAEKPVRTEKMAKPPRQVTRFEINSGTAPDVAARKIVGKFGKDYALRLAAL